MKKLILTTIASLLTFFIGTSGFDAPNKRASLVSKIKFAAQLERGMAYASDEEKAAEWAEGMWRILAGEPGMAKDDYIMGWLEELLNNVSDGITDLGFASCSAVPASGTYVHPTEPVDITFQVSNKVVPMGSNFFNAGLSYDKSLTASHGGDEFIHIEFDCDSNNPNMYVRYDNSVMSSSLEERVIEIHAQANLATNRIAIDFSMTCVSGDCQDQTNMYLSMYTPDGDEFKIIGTLTQDELGSPETKRMSLHGRKSLKIADIHFMDLANLNNTDDINPTLNPATVKGVCVDFNVANYVAAGGACAALSADNELDLSTTNFFGLSNLHGNTVSSQTLTY